MSREIKFRVWDGKQFLRSYADNGESFWYGKNGTVGVDWFIQCQRLETVTRFWVQQFSGLRDSSGNKICEGDIIHVGGWRYPRQEVVFSNGSFRGINPYVGEGYSIHDLLKANVVNVVGNIFENTELLNNNE